MDPALQQALDMLDKAAAIIQELVAQVQSKPQQEDMSKKAESIAAKTGMSFNAANDMIKQASENGTSVEAILKAADLFTNKFSFGKVWNLKSSNIFFKRHNLLEIIRQESNAD